MSYSSDTETPNVEYCSIKSLHFQVGAVYTEPQHGKILSRMGSVKRASEQDGKLTSVPFIPNSSTVSVTGGRRKNNIKKAVRKGLRSEPIPFGTACVRACVRVNTPCVFRRSPNNPLYPFIIATATPGTRHSHRALPNDVITSSPRKP